MYLVVFKTIEYITTCIFKLLRIVNVVLFIKAGFQFNQNIDFLAILRCLTEVFHESCMTCKTIDRDLDRYDMWIIGCFFDKIDEWSHGIIWVGKQDILLLNLGKQFLFVVELFCHLWFIWFIEEFLLLFFIDKFAKREGILHGEWRIGDKYHLLCDIEMSHQILGKYSRRFVAEHKSCGIHLSSFPQYLHHLLTVITDIIKCFIIRIDISTAVDLQLDTFLDFIIREQFPGKVTHNVFSMDIAKIVFIWQYDNVAQCARHIDKAKYTMFLHLQYTGNIGNTCHQIWERMVGIHNLCCQ